MIFIFDIIKQFMVNVLINSTKENPFYVVENLILGFIVFLILYFFVIKKKYSFYNILFTGFFSIITKNLGKKFTDSYLLRFAYVTPVRSFSLFAVVQNLLSLVAETLTIKVFSLFVWIAFTFFFIYQRFNFFFYV